MTEDIRDSAAADEQSAEHQRVRGEDPLLASVAESQCGRITGSAVVTIVTSSTTTNCATQTTATDVQPDRMLLPAKALMLGTYPAAAQACDW